MFKDVFDFVARTDSQKVNTKTFVALTRAGAFDKMGYLRTELEENVQMLYNYFKGIIEYEERLQEIKERNAENEVILPKIERRNELRKLVKKHRRLFEKNKREISELDMEKIERELENLEEQKLKKKVSLKQKELPEKPSFTRTKTVELNFKQIVEQANYIGCYIETHPVTLVNTHTQKIANLHQGEYATVAAVVTNLKVIKTRKTNRKMAFMELDDSETICEAVIFPHTYAKIEDMNIEVGSLVTAKIKVEQVDPIKLIVNQIVLYKE